MSSDEPKSAKANPTKQFFVNMITRDITLEDSILDLVDNSIDSAWARAGSHHIGLKDQTDLSQYTVSIQVSATSFLISDNCGGMTLDDAVDHAFNFGRRSTDEPEDYSIGVYGIGMKRAVFKLGRTIRIRSTYEDYDGSTVAFAVPINVTDWLGDDSPPWDFDLVDDDALEDCGVQIFVGDLVEGVAASFESPEFVQSLRRIIARDYALYLERGLVVKVNGKPVEGVELAFLQSDDFTPMRTAYEDIHNGDSVSVEIVGGMAALPPDEISPDEIDKGHRDNRFGWYVACNGRLVLAADKSTVSGWGLPDWPQWHPQYTGFSGMVFFSSANASALPLTTTKRSVDTTSNVFLRARPKMRELTKEWTAYTNARKQALEEAKQKEREAKPIRIRQVAIEPRITLPRLRRVRAERVANVNYAVPLVRMKGLAEAFGKVTLSYREVGLKSFDYAYEDLVEED